MKLPYTALLCWCLVSGLSACQPQPVGQQEPQRQQRGKDVEPGRLLSFPTDHGAHEAYGIEWWYLTANLEDDQGRYHAVQWTLFRFLGEPGDNPWWQGNWYMGHLMHEDDKGHRAWERWGRGNVGDEYRGQAGVRAAPFSAWIDDWTLASASSEYLPLHLVAGQEDFHLALAFDNSPIVAHGEDGFSRKSADGTLASYYYSLPALQVDGHVKTAEGWVRVRGQAWLDREWSSRFLDDRYQGWDWLSAHLDGGERMMVFCLRPVPGQDESLRHCEGSWLSADGQWTGLKPEHIRWQATDWSVLDDGRYPVAWELDLASKGKQWQISTRRKDQRNQLTFPYWEGPVVIEGVEGTVGGQGFIEMTGYREH